MNGGCVSEHVTLELLDAEQALREALDESASASRGEFLKRAVVAGGPWSPAAS